MSSEWKEETLDPENWDELRELGHRMLDDMMDYHRSIRDRPVWRSFETAFSSLKEGPPRMPQGAEKTYQEFKDIILESFSGLALHPRFWGWVTGTASPSGMLAEMLTGGLNASTEFGTEFTYYVERQVLTWIKEMLGYPSEASGILVSGATMANLIGITVARNNKCDYDVRKHGLKFTPRKMTLYCSSETHMAIQKSVELLGLGAESLRFIPVTKEFKIDIQALKESIDEDESKGHQPFCIIGNAGTVNTGSFDDLDALAGICEDHSLWFHVDGAFGAWTAITPKLRRLSKGMERADSLALDLHKWMNLPYDIGCVLVRDEKAHRGAFTLTPEYLELPEGLPPPLQEYGIELSRRFRALKAWMSIKEHGTEKHGRIIQQNVDQTRYLEKLVNETPELELLAPVPLNIVCFRYKLEGLDDEKLNGFNNLLLMVLQSNGIAIPSNTTIDGKFAIRFCNVNHRTKYEDLEYFVKEVVRIGRMLQDPETQKKYEKQVTEKISALMKF